MFVQTLNTPNPNSLKFLPGEKVSLSGPVEFNKKDETSNELVRNILSINGVVGIFLSEDFLSVKKDEKKEWEEIKHIIIAFINEFYSEGNKYVYKSSTSQNEDINLDEIEKKIIKILDTKIRPAVARDGGDIKFKEYKDGKVKVEMQGSCSGCPSSTMTLKRGVENILKHYIPEITEVIPV
jgi:Fe-S cluster biogenesis protein NfuA|tara:strand:+ start:3619 stop:4161 length:543 start_codon:yes stop_codon:yes gene_type:complete